MRQKLINQTATYPLYLVPNGIAIPFGPLNNEIVSKWDLVIFVKRRTVRRIRNKLVEQDLCFSSINDHQESKVR